LTIIFFTRVATVDVVLWEDSPSWQPAMGNTVHME